MIAHKECKKNKLVKSLMAYMVSCGLALFGLDANALDTDYVPVGTGSLPSFQLGKADLVSPAQANTLGLYSSTTSTNGAFVSPGTAQEITDLANSIYVLSNNNLDAFVKRTYNYVYSEIAPEFRFGSSKGALGALFDKSGTPFDQAQLFKQLLNVKGVSATYIVGEATFTGTQFTDWTGISTAKEACQLLANGGIPASINGASPADCNLSGNLSSVTMVHIWVDVAGYGPADPSFKKMTYTAPTSLLDSYISYNRAGFLSSAAPMGVSSSGVSDQLVSLSKNYYNAVNASQSKAATQAIVGGADIAYKKVALDPLSLPYTTVPKLSAPTGIPNQMRTKLRMSLYSKKVIDNTNFTDIEDFYADETYGRHLAFEPYQHPMVQDNGTCSLNFDGQGKVGGFYVFSRMELEINHPYLARQPGTMLDNSFMDEKAEFLVNCQLPTSIVQGYGTSGAALEESFASSQSESRKTIVGQYSTPNLNGSTAYYIATATTMGKVSVGSAAYKYLAESSSQMNFFGNLTQTDVERHHVIGLSGQSPKTSYDGHYSIKYQGLQLDLHSRVSATVRNPNQTNVPSQLALGRSLSWLSSTAEGGTIKRANSAIDAFSTAERFSWGVEKNVTFYKLTPGSSVPTLQLINFPATNTQTIQLPLSDETQPVADKLRAKVQDYLAAGYTVTIPGVAIMGPGELAWEYHPAPPCNSTCATAPSFLANLGIQFGATFYAEKASTGEFAHILVDQNGFSKGGGAGIEAPKIGGASLNAPKTDDRQKVDTGVQKTTGNVDYSFKNVITLGSGALPYGLSTNISVKTKTKEPRYSSVATVSVQAGNASTYEQWWQVERMFEVSEVGSANFSADLAKSLGARTPLEAASTVAAMKALLDINSASDTEINANTSSPNRFLLSALISRWLDRQMDDNTLRLTSTRGSTEFVRQAIGGYLPQPGSAESVSISGSPDILQAVNNIIEGSTTPGYEHYLQSRRKTDTFNFTRTFADKSFELYSVAGTSVGNNPNLWHPLTKYQNASGVSVSYEYDQYQNLTKLSNSLGRVLTFANSYLTNKQLDITDNAGRKVTVSETSSGVDLTGLDGKVWTVALSKSATGTSRPLLGWAVTGVHNPESAVADNKAIVKYKYDNNWRATAVDLKKDATSYWVDAYKWALLPGYANAEVDGATAIAADYFDNKGRLAYSTDASKVQTITAYDTWGRDVEKRVFPSATALKSIAANSNWSASPEVTLYNNSYLQRTGKSYDDKSNPTTEWLYPAAGSAGSVLRTDHTYDSVCNKVKADSFRYADGGTATTSVTNDYDQSNCLLKTTTTAAGLVTNYTYNANGLPTLVTEGSSSAVVRKKAIEYTYDNITKFTTSKGDGTSPLVVTATYNNLLRGDIESVTDPRNITTTATYDNARRITETFAPYNTGTKYDYNVNGQLVQVHSKVYAGGEAVTSATLNPLGWMTELKDPLNHKQSFDYDARGLLIKTTDAENRATKYTYDLSGKLTCQQDGFGTTLVRSYKLYGYNELGQLVSSNPAKADPNGTCVLDVNNQYQTKYTYDAYGQAEKTIYPDNTYEKQSYNASGTVSSKLTRAGVAINSTYDAANRLASKSILNQYTANYSYNIFSKPTSINQTGASASTLTFNYDFMDRLSSSSQQLSGGSARTVAFEYDNNGNRTKVTWPEGYAIDYMFDDLNRLSNVQANNKTLNLAIYQYNVTGSTHAPGNTAVNVIYGNGTVTKTEALADGTLSTLSHDLAATTDYVKYSFGNNAAHQITSQTLSNRNFQWRPKTSYSASYAVNKLDQYTSVDGGAGAAAFGYDLNGNLVTTDKGVFTYDAENKLTSATMNASAPQGALAVSYTYDANGRRTQKSVTQNSATTTTQYLSENDNEIAEYLNGSSTPSKRFIYGKNVDEIIAMQDVATNSYSYAHRNHQGSIIAVSDSSGNVSSDNTYTYSAYGEPETLSGKGSAGFPYRYTGRRIDTETGLYYYRARYYDPQLGRFMQVDPIGYKDQMNLYGYVKNDPVDKTDPTGLCPQCLPAALVGGTISLVSDYISSGGEMTWQKAAGSFIGGAMTGVLVANGVPLPTANAIGSATSEATTQLAEVGSNERNGASVGKIVASAIIGGAVGKLVPGIKTPTISKLTGKFNDALANVAKGTMGKVGLLAASQGVLGGAAEGAAQQGTKEVLDRKDASGKLVEAAAQPAKSCLPAYPYDCNTKY